MLVLALCLVIVIHQAGLGDKSEKLLQSRHAEQCTADRALVSATHWSVMVTAIVRSHVRHVFMHHLQYNASTLTVLRMTESRHEQSSWYASTLLVKLASCAVSV